MRIGDVYAERSERGAEDMELLSVTMNDGVKMRSDIEGKDNSSEDKSNYKIVRAGDMVYNSMRMWQGANGISPWDGIVSPAYTVLKPRMPISNGFFAALFKTRRLINEFRKNSQGMTSDTWNLKYPQIETIKTCIPALAEQEKIADFLMALDQRIEKQRTLVEHLKKYKRGLLDAIFNQKIHVTDGNEEWQECRIGDILKIMHGRDYKDYKAPNGEYPVLGTGGVIDYSTKYLCDWPCVLIGRKGTIDKPQYMDKPFWTVDTLFYSKPEHFHNPKFQYYLFQTINWKKYNEASGVPSQSASTIEGITVYVPNLKTQEIIADLLTKIDVQIENYSNTQVLLQVIKKGLFQEIFT